VIEDAVVWSAEMSFCAVPKSVLSVVIELVFVVMLDVFEATLAWIEVSVFCNVVMLELIVDT